MRSTTSITLSLLASKVLASTGTLDSIDDNLVDNVDSSNNSEILATTATAEALESATVAAATKSFYQSEPVAYSVVEGTIATASETLDAATITDDISAAGTTTYNSRLVHTSNVVSQATQQYADQPSYTIVTTNELGQTTTEYKWWVPETTTATAQSAEASETVSAAYSALSVTIPSAGSASSVEVESSESVDAISATTTASGINSDGTSTSKWAYGPVTTVTSVDANGNDYTSTLWWVPSTTYTWAGESSSSAAASGAVSASVKTVKSVFVSTSNSKKVTRTSTYETTMLNKAKQTNSVNSTASVHSNSTNGIDHLVALDTLKYVALAAFLL